MNDFIAFVIHHWELWLAFVLILLYWLFFEYQEHKGGRGLSAQQVVNYINREHAIVIDIRDAEAYAKGHVIGALSFPEKNLMNELKKLKKLKKYQKKPIILIDAQGISPNKIINKLIQEGYEKVYFLKNGVQAWQAANMPLTKT